MTEAVIEAVYHDYKRVPSRKAFQIICEIPIEKAPLVHKMLGEPNPDGSTWVAIAMLDPGEMAVQPQANPQETTETNPGESKRNWEDLKPSQQAGMLCANQAFQVFMDASSEEETAEAVRIECGVKSRSELDTHDLARENWDQLNRLFEAWRRAPQHGVG